MRTKSVFLNIIFSLILQIVTIILGIILPRQIILIFGSEINGFKSSLAQLIGYFYILEAGLGSAIIITLYKPIAQNNITKINTILSSSMREYRKIGFIFTFLVVLISLIYPIFIDVSTLTYFESFLLSISIGASGVINFFFIGNLTVFFTASQKAYVLHIARTIYVILNTLIIVSLINLGFSIAFAYFFSILANIIQFIFLNIYIRKQHPYIDTKLSEKKVLFSKRNDVFVHQISGMLASVIPILYLTIFQNLKLVSVYSIYFMLFSSINLITGIVGSSFTAAFGDIFAKKDYRKMQESYNDFEFIYYYFVAFVFSCTSILMADFIKIYTSSFNDIEYYNKLLLILFLVNGLFLNLKVPQSIVINATGHFKETKWHAIFESIILVIIAIPLTIKWNIFGIVIAGTISIAYRYVDVFYSAKLTNHSISITFSRMLKVICVLLISYLPIIFFDFIKINNILDILSYIIPIAIWAFITTNLVMGILDFNILQSLFIRLKKMILNNK